MPEFILNPAPAVDASIARGAARLRTGGLPTLLTHADGLGIWYSRHNFTVESLLREYLLTSAKAIIRQERAKAASGHWAFNQNRLMAAHELRAALEEPSL